MINFQTVIFMDILNYLAKKSKDGIHKFSTAQEIKGIMYDDSDEKNRVIESGIIKIGYHDIISYYDELFPDDEVQFQVVIGDNEEPYVLVSTSQYPNFWIVIQDGTWEIISY